MNQLTARQQDGYFGEHTGSLSDHCEAVTPIRFTYVASALDGKIKQAITAAIGDRLIRRTGSGQYAFTIDGEGQFYNHLLGCCTQSEKAELLHEWVLTGDIGRAVGVADYLMADFNPIKAIARDQAEVIINHCLFADHTGGELARSRA